MTRSSTEAIETAPQPPAQNVHTPASIEAVALEVPDVARARDFYEESFGVQDELRLRPSAEASSGFRGFTLSLVVSQPSNVEALFGAALDAGATVLKPAKKGLWGYGGVLRAPDGAIWKIATSARKDTGPASRDIDAIVLLLGVSDFVASRQFYVDRGLVVARSFARAYAEFAMPDSTIKLALYKRRALAKDAGVPADGAGSHRIAVCGDLGPLTDPDGFTWEAA